MPNHTWTDSDGVEWMRVDIPRGAHGNWLAGIREDPECMDEDEYGPDYNHSYCHSSDSDECWASEFTYDARGLISTFRQEVKSKGSHDHRIIQYPAYFTAEEIAAAYKAVGRVQPDPNRGITSDVHSMQVDQGLMQVINHPEPTRMEEAYERYMRNMQMSFDRMVARYTSRQSAESSTLFDFINQPMRPEPNADTDFTEGM